MKRLAEIDNIVGIKEASGDIGQIASILGHLPEDFMVLSGDDALALPIIALGGSGLISVVSNEIPAEMTQLVRCCLENDFAAGAAAAAQISAADGSELRRIESDSGEIGHGRDGPARAGVAASLVSHRGPKTRRKSAACWNPWAWWERGMLQEQIEALFDKPPERYSDRAPAAFSAI